MGRKKIDLTEKEAESLNNFELPIAPETINETKTLDELSQLSEQLVPLRTDVEWHDYVMSQLSPDEIYDGKPSTDGLRRLVELLVGNIVYSGTNVIEAAHFTENETLTPVTVEYKVIIKDNIMEKDVTYVEAAQVSHQNTKPEFLRYAVETATTRAEGRAYRKILKLRKTITQEEADSPAVNEIEMNGKIRPDQKNFIDVLCRRNNVNVINYINSGSQKYKNIDEVTYTKALEMIKFLSKLEQHNELIKEEIVGYDSNWKNREF